MLKFLQIIYFGGYKHVYIIYWVVHYKDKIVSIISRLNGWQSYSCWSDINWGKMLAVPCWSFRVLSVRLESGKFWQWLHASPHRWQLPRYIGHATGYDVLNPAADAIHCSRNPLKGAEIEWMTRVTLLIIQILEAETQKMCNILPLIGLKKICLTSLHKIFLIRTMKFIRYYCRRVWGMVLHSGCAGSIPRTAVVNWLGADWGCRAYVRVRGYRMQINAGFET